MAVWYKITGAVPPPPMIGGGFPGVPVKKAVIPNVKLPMLNWVPVRNPGQTIFKVGLGLCASRCCTVLYA